MLLFDGPFQVIKASTAWGQAAVGVGNDYLDRFPLRAPKGRR